MCIVFLIQSIKSSADSERKRCETLEATVARLETELVSARKSTNNASDELLHRALAAEAEARKQGLLAQQAQQTLELAEKDTARVKEWELKLKREVADLRAQLHNAKSEASKWRSEMHSLQTSCEEVKIRAEAAERGLSSSRLLTLASVADTFA